MQLPAPMLIAAQHAVNKILQLDPGVAQHLDALYGKVVQLHFDGIDTDVYLMFVAQGIEVMSFFDGDVDTVLAGSPGTMASLYSDNSALFSGAVVITGDVKVARQFKALVAGLDVDWEEQIAGITGDAVAHQLFRAGRDLHAFIGRGLSHFALDTGEYLQEEVQLVAPNSELEQFCHEVDELVSDIDRLEARLQQFSATQAVTQR